MWEDGSQHTVYITTPGTRATGAPSISGNVVVGQTLTVDTSAIVDADGLTSPTFFCRWFRIAGGKEYPLFNRDATSATYKVRLFHVGSRLKVEVLFVDDEGNTEVLSSTPTGEVPGPPTIDTITVDTRPLVTSHADGLDYYANGSEIELSVNFTKAVDVTGTPQLEFFIGNESKRADYDSTAISRRAVKFKYTVEPGDRGAVSVRSDPVKLSTGETITDDDGAAADLFFEGTLPSNQRALGVPFSLELAGDADGVTLLARCIDREVVRGQIAAHYPQARIQEVPVEEDPIFVHVGEEAWGMTLRAGGPEYVPLRTFRDDDLLDPGSDPLIAIIGALST